MAVRRARQAHCGNTRIMNQEENNNAFRGCLVSECLFNHHHPGLWGENPKASTLTICQSVLAISAWEQGKCFLSRHVYTVCFCGHVCVCTDIYKYTKVQKNQSTVVWHCFVNKYILHFHPSLCNPTYKLLLRMTELPLASIRKSRIDRSPRYKHQ